jgi:hypothetical protein
MRGTGQAGAGSREVSYLVHHIVIVAVFILTLEGAVF